MDTGTGNGIALARLGYDEYSQSRLERAASPGDQDNQHIGFSLPRADGGKDAWLFLAGAFAIEALVWGK